MSEETTAACQNENEEMKCSSSSSPPRVVQKTSRLKTSEESEEYCEASSSASCSPLNMNGQDPHQHPDHDFDEENGALQIVEDAGDENLSAKSINEESSPRNRQNMDEDEEEEEDKLIKNNSWTFPSSATTLLNKNEVKSASKTPVFKCPVCKENFKSKRSFNSHILIHCQVSFKNTFKRKRLITFFHFDCS